MRRILLAAASLFFLNAFSLSASNAAQDDGYVAHGDAMFYLRGGDGTVVMVPQDYVLGFSYGDSRFSASLIDGGLFEVGEVVEVSNLVPDDLPAFSSYKFNNKYNSQVFTDVECQEPKEDCLSLSVGCIGKWLTASFQFTAEGTTAWVDGVPQRSKKTRQSFAEPVVYELKNNMWQELRLVVDGDGLYSREYADLCRKVTVSVDFLSDHPTSEYGVPRIDITLSNTDSWSSENWIGMNGKTYYEDATIEIDGAGVFPDMEVTPIQIKGRGNTSWKLDWQSKNPYHFKFETKQKPLGMKNGKHWILLANKMASSMTTNALGHKVGNLLETAGTNHIVPVELYINGSYRGSYNLTERVGFSNNSVDIEDETYAAMIEMDTYTDEPIYTSNIYGLPAKIHKPDLDDGETQLTAEIIMDDYDSMMASVYMETDDFLHQVDANYLARYLLACEMIENNEVCHPKSVYLYSENVTDGFNLSGDDETPWVFGPLWDCDWAFAYSNGDYFINNIEKDYYSSILSGGNSQGVAGHFFNSLRFNSVEVDSIYYGLMYKFVNNGSLDELIDYCDEYYEFAKQSFWHNETNETTEQDGGDYALITEHSKNWLAQRAEFVFANLTPYEVVEEEDDDDDDDDVEESIAPYPESRRGNSDTIYDLSGRAVGEQEFLHRRGVFIINGRKVLR